jgi:hypothetical protein
MREYSVAAKSIGESSAMGCFLWAQRKREMEEVSFAFF